MPRIKMSDVTSGSENVKKVFREPMPNRTVSMLKNFKFSNDELVEIHFLADKKESHGEKREFFNIVILSQTGPFNSKVFDIYAKSMFDKDSLIHLIKNSTGLTDEDKETFIVYSITTEPIHFIANFFMTGECKKYGIDLKKSPCNKAYVRSYITSSSQTTTRFFDNERRHAFLYEILDTLTESELFEWYENTLSQRQFKIKIILGYKNCPEKLFVRAFESIETGDITTKKQMAMDPKCPLEIKMKMFEETGDGSLLPQDIQEIFIF